MKDLKAYNEKGRKYMAKKLKDLNEKYKNTFWEEAERRVYIYEKKRNKVL